MYKLYIVIVYRSTSSVRDLKIPPDTKLVDLERIAMEAIEREDPGNYRIASSVTLNSPIGTFWELTVN